MIFLFWDIDGTLLTTARAGVFAWEDACREITGGPIDLQGFKTDGLTDHQIAMKLLEHVDASARDEATALRMVRHYESRLPMRLPLRQGKVLNGAHGLLRHLRDSRPDVHSMLLTGNTAEGARAKLLHYGLHELFDEGAFSEDMGPRSGVAIRALAAVRRRFPAGEITADQLLVIGDTPHDIDCARAIGARTIAVATGGYSVDELAAHGAWRALARLPEPAAFESLLGESVQSLLAP
jgi:phosphoglycolate phosphatase